MKNQKTANKREYWVTPFDKIVGAVDEKAGTAQIYEYHARGTCTGASAWVAYHYPRTSSIVTAAETEGARNIFTLKLGMGKLDLEPSVSPAGIESVVINNDELKITYAGLAGAGVGISHSRSFAKNISKVNIIKAGGGSKLGRAEFYLPLMHKWHIGIDDTDTKEKGATWSLSNEIGYAASKKKGVEYLNHTIVQLYPRAPGKTKNCVSSVISFAVMPDKKKMLVEFIRNELKLHTYSNDTGMAVLEGIAIPGKLKRFSDECRQKVVTVKRTFELADALGIQLIEITGKKGLIGAAGGLGYAEQHDKAVKLPI